MNPLFTAFEQAKPYKGKTLNDWFGEQKLFTVRDKDLNWWGRDFFKTMATWVFRNLTNRRKGGVPTGELTKFVYSETTEINFLWSMMVYIVLTLRKRGLVELDSRPSETFQKLVDAFDRAPKLKEEK